MAGNPERHLPQGLRERDPRRIADLLYAARQQVDSIAPSVDLSTAFTARYPWGHGPERVKRAAVDIIATTRLDIDRPLSDHEAKAILRATRLRISAEGQAHWLSVALAAALWYRGVKTYRFPFYTPKRPPLGGGPLAQTMRMVAYTTLCLFGMSPVEQSIGLMGAMNAEEEDKKILHEIGKEIKGARGTVVNNRIRGAQGMPGQQQQQQQQPQQQSAVYTTRWPSDDQARSQEEQQQSSGSHTARWPDDPSTQYDPEPSQTSYQSSTSNTPEQTPSDRWSSSSIIDDASPIAPEESQSSSNAQPAGSSWARLRQQARAQQQGQPQGSWQQVRKTGAEQQQTGWSADDGSGMRSGQPRESYSFSSADAERDLAKVQAQKEFDAMLERERRGEGGSQGGWR